MSSLRRNPAAAWRHVDVVLIGATLSVSALGVLMVYSATRGPSAPYHTDFFHKQAAYLAMGAGVMVFTSLVDYRAWRQWCVPAYVGACGLLLAVITTLGKSAKGAPRWFQLSSFQLQPSELAKLTVIVVVAALAARFEGEIYLRRLIALLFVAGLPIGLITMQPDLGTGLVVLAVLAAVLLVAGIRGRHLAVLTVLGVALVAIALHSHLLAQYQTARLTSFLAQDTHLTANPELAKAKYNVDQSKIAIGAGGALGEGLFRGTQTRLGNVPEQHTDFIFTAVGEQLGFAGAATVLFLLAIVVWRVWRTAQLSRDQFGTLLCVGVLGMLMFQVFENAGMTMGIMPVTGIPLPFVSYGGTATLSEFAAVGLVLNIHMHRFA